MGMLGTPGVNKENPVERTGLLRIDESPGRKYEPTACAVCPIVED